MEILRFQSECFSLCINFPPENNRCFLRYRIMKYLIVGGVAGGATAAEVNELIEHVRAEVKRQFGVELEPEVRRVGEF